MTDHAIIARDPEGLIIGWNAGAERLLGYAASEIVGNPIGRVLPQAELDKLHRLEQLVQQRQSVSPLRLLHVSKQGETRALDVSVVLTLAPDGAVAMITQFASAGTFDQSRWFGNRGPRDFGDSPEVGERERRFRQMIDAFPQLIWRSMTDGQINLLTARWEEFTGRSLDSLMGEAWLDVLHPDDRGAFVARWREARDVGVEWRRELRLRHRDGRYYWMEMTCWPIVDSEGTIICWIGSFANINEMRETQRALLEERERFARLVASAPGAIYEFRVRPDGSGSFPLVSAGIKDLYPISLEALAQDARVTERFMHPNDLEPVYAAIAYSAEHLTPFRCEWRINHPDKGELWAEARSVPIREPDGSTLWFGIIFDITERKHAEELLRMSQARLQAVVLAGGIGTWVRDLQPDSVWWDERMLAIWGRTAAEVNGLPAARALPFIHPDDRTAIGASLQRTGGKEAAFNEFRIVHPDGSLRWVSVNGSIERDANGIPVRLIGACTDITDRRRVEESQRRSQRLEALGTLAGGIAHDFNNILLAISGNARMAIADLPSEHQLQISLNEIDKAAVRATRLVQRILAFSRQTEPRREVIQLQPTVEEALKLLRSTLPAMIQIKTQFAPNVPAINADSTQIHQVVMNLLTNSAHAIGEQAGVVTVSIDTVPLPHDLVPELASSNVGRYVRLTVSDTGVGMPAETVDRIFDPFFTTKPVGQGTGLGLSVVHGIVRSHRGAITVDSAPDSGATFRLYFPPVENVETRPSEGLREPAQGRGQRIMYVDDEDALVYLVTRKLQKLGYAVSGFTDPAAAIRAFEAAPDAFDVVVTDMSMPGMSGFHLAKAILDIRPATPVLMTSGYVRQQDRDAALQLGVRDLIMKPNTIDELGQVLASMFEATPSSIRARTK